jgi:hypothetical protein
MAAAQKVIEVSFALLHRWRERQSRSGHHQPCHQGPMDNPFSPWHKKYTKTWPLLPSDFACTGGRSKTRI